MGLGDRAFHGAKPIDSSTIGGAKFLGQIACPLHLGGDIGALGSESGPGVHVQSGSDFIEAQEPASNVGERA